MKYSYRNIFIAYSAFPAPTLVKLHKSFNFALSTKKSTLKGLIVKIELHFKHYSVSDKKHNGNPTMMPRYIEYYFLRPEKKGALGFFALRKIKFWETALFLKLCNRENKSNQFSQILRAL